MEPWERIRPIQDIQETIGSVLAQTLQVDDEGESPEEQAKDYHFELPGEDIHEDDRHLAEVLNPSEVGPFVEPDSEDLG